MFGGCASFVLESQRASAIREMWSGILLLRVLGHVLCLGFVLVERRLLRWRMSALG